VTEFSAWTTRRVQVAVGRMVLDLFKDDKPAGRYTVCQSGTISPELPPGQRDLLVAQALALRGELAELEPLWIAAADGWHVLRLSGHEARVRREEPSRFLVMIDGKGWTAPAFPDDLEFVKKAVADVARNLQLAERYAASPSAAPRSRARPGGCKSVSPSLEDSENARGVP
jgi:hypothetical protein